MSSVRVIDLHHCGIPFIRFPFAENILAEWILSILSDYYIFSISCVRDTDRCSLSILYCAVSVQDFAILFENMFDLTLFSLGGTYTFSIFSGLYYSLYRSLQFIVEHPV